MPAPHTARSAASISPGDRSGRVESRPGCGRARHGRRGRSSPRRRTRPRISRRPVEITCSGQPARPPYGNPPCLSPPAQGPEDEPRRSAVSLRQVRVVRVESEHSGNPVSSGPRPVRGTGRDRRAMLPSATISTQGRRRCRPPPPTGGPSTHTRRGHTGAGLVRATTMRIGSQATAARARRSSSSGHELRRALTGAGRAPRRAAPAARESNSEPSARAARAIAWIRHTAHVAEPDLVPPSVTEAKCARHARAAPIPYCVVRRRKARSSDERAQLRGGARCRDRRGVVEGEAGAMSGPTEEIRRSTIRGACARRRGRNRPRASHRATSPSENPRRD